MEIKCKIEICLLLEELQKFCTQLKKIPRIKNKSWSWRFLSCTWQSETERQWESETERQWQANRKKKKRRVSVWDQTVTASIFMSRHSNATAANLNKLEADWNSKCYLINRLRTICKVQCTTRSKDEAESDTHTRPCTVLFIPMWKEIQLFKHLSNLFVLFKKWSCVCEIFINEAEEKILDERGKLSACLLHSDNQAVTDNSAMWTVQKKAPHCRFFSKI